MIFTLAKVLSTIGNVRVNDPLLIVPELIIEWSVDHPSFEYCNIIPVVQKLISVPVVQVIVFDVPPIFWETVPLNITFPALLRFINQRVKKSCLVKISRQ